MLVDKPKRLRDVIVAQHHQLVFYETNIPQLTVGGPLIKVSSTILVNLT